MTIAELFVAIGVKVDGADKVTNVDRRMDDAARSARRMTLGVNAINAAMLLMMDTAARAGQVLQNFAISTGLSTEELQMWQHTAAGAGISVDEVTKSISALQSQRAEFALGNPQAVGAWSLLGVSPLQDPFKVLQDLRVQIQKFPDAGIARKLLGDVGLEGLMPILRGTNEEFERWNRNFIVTQAGGTTRSTQCSVAKSEVVGDFGEESVCGGTDTGVRDFREGVGASRGLPCGSRSVA